MGTKIFSWLTLILWMVFIFSLSSQMGEQSDELSKGITGIIVRAVEKIAPSGEFDTKGLNHIVRKGAHFFLYFILGILAADALRRSGVQGYRWIMLALGICILYAGTDELHQLLVPGRGGQLMDVIIDSAGGVVGIGVYWLVVKG